MKLTKLTDHLKLATDKLVGFKPEPYELNPGFGEATESIYKMVDQFHELFQHPRRVMPTPELLRLRAKLIHEEAVEEGLPAAKKGDMQGLLDAMADFLYVGVGTMVAIKGGLSTGMSYYTQELLHSGAKRRSLYSYHYGAWKYRLRRYGHPLQ